MLSKCIRKHWYAVLVPEWLYIFLHATTSACQHALNAWLEHSLFNGSWFMPQFSLWLQPACRNKKQNAAKQTNACILFSSCQCFPCTDPEGSRWASSAGQWYFQTCISPESEAPTTTQCSTIRLQQKKKKRRLNDWLMWWFYYVKNLMIESFFFKLSIAEDSERAKQSWIKRET